MTKRALNYSILAVMFLGAMSLASASTCASLVSGGPIDVTSLDGCTVDIGSNIYTFSNFAYVAAGGNTSGWAGLDLVQGGVSVVGNEISFNFNPNEQVGGVTDVHFQYQISGVGINGSSLAVTAADTGATISEENCTMNPSNNQVSLDGGNCGTGSNIDLLNLSVAQSGPLTASGTFASQSEIWVWKDIEITTNGHDSSFTEDVTASAVPEPMTMSLMGAGLLGLGLLGRRMRRK